MDAPHDAGHRRDAASFPLVSGPLAGVAADDMMPGEFARRDTLAELSILGGASKELCWHTTC